MREIPPFNLTITIFNILIDFLNIYQHYNIYETHPDDRVLNHDVQKSYVVAAYQMLRICDFRSPRIIHQCDVAARGINSIEY